MAFEVAYKGFILLRFSIKGPATSSLCELSDKSMCQTRSSTRTVGPVIEVRIGETRSRGSFCQLLVSSSVQVAQGAEDLLFVPFSQNVEHPSLLF